jgi:hypothetical protein
MVTVRKKDGIGRNDKMTVSFKSFHPAGKNKPIITGDTSNEIIDSYNEIENIQVRLEAINRTIRRVERHASKVVFPLRRSCIDLLNVPQYTQMLSSRDVYIQRQATDTRVTNTSQLTYTLQHSCLFSHLQ